MDNNNLFNNNENNDTNAVNPTNEASSNIEPTPENNAAAPIQPNDIAVSTHPTAPTSNTETEQPSAPAMVQPSYSGHSNSAQSNGAPDFSKYQDATSNFAQIPRDTVYINNQPTKKKKEKAPKGRIGAGAVAAIVAVCMVFSGGAAFVGTYAANQMTASEQPSSSNNNNIGKPSVIFQSFDNANKVAGTYEQVAEAVSPTVVEITTESVSTSSTFWGSSYVISGAGSGVIISADGLIITNNHVVSGANTIKVTLKDGTSYDAKLIGTDSDSDIAVIKIEATNLPCALVGNSDSLKVGQEVVAIGNPLGNLGGTVTNGIISALSREVNIEGTEMTLLQTNAAVNPGNSGGGLFNMYGELIGIVNAKSSTTSSGTAVEGIGFAIPVKKATEVATELVNYGYVRGKVMLGITCIDISDAFTAMQYGVSEAGAYVGSSTTEELKPGDRIVAIDDVQVIYSAEIKSLLKNYKVGDEITVKVVRGGQYYDVKVTLQEYVPVNADSNAANNKGN
ncbi:MAG: trypsin-like serine protease [Clostridiales bacterium]|nr:trypsin-like serine protease [Clostridiales bacterium]